MDDYIVTDEHGRALRMEDLPSVRLLRGEPAEPLLLHSVNRDGGDVRWRLLKAALLHDDDGEIIAAVTVIENVTAVKTAEMRMRVLAESGRLLVSSLDYEQTLQQRRKRRRSRDRGLVHGRSDRRAASGARTSRSPTAIRRGRSLPRRLRELEPDELDPGRAMTRVLTTGVSELYEDVSDEQLAQSARSAEELALLRGLELRSVAIVPMRVPKRILGVMTLVTAESRRKLTMEDLALAEQLARRAAVAVENARLHTTLSEIAATLQQSLLPGRAAGCPRVGDRGAVSPVRRRRPDRRRRRLLRGVRDRRRLVRTDRRRHRQGRQRGGDDIADALTEHDSRAASNRGRPRSFGV